MIDIKNKLCHFTQKHYLFSYLTSNIYGIIILNKILTNQVYLLINLIFKYLQQFLLILLVDLSTVDFYPKIYYNSENFLFKSLISFRNSRNISFTFWVLFSVSNSWVEILHAYSQISNTSFRRMSYGS